MNSKDYKKDIAFEVDCLICPQAIKPPTQSNNERNPGIRSEMKLRYTKTEVPKADDLLYLS